ncbi:hypothetical protein [Maritalea sp.]|uniref:hypothetical protein n=1 Tax=Maritalea sp. TaxID=2003361 RepID=UPI003EF180A0
MQKEIVLKNRYDWPYRLAVWRRCREIVAKKRLSADTFYTNEIMPKIEDNIDLIKAEFDPNYRFEWHVDNELRIVSDFLMEGDTRKFGLKRFHMFDAYVQIASPKFVTLTNGKEDLDKMGEIVGHFLRDPSMGELSYLLAQAKQKLLHFFSYDNVDTLGAYDETERYLCLFVGETPDYLFALDFAYVESDIVPLYDEKLRLYYGFCAPGEDFSPIVMRSYCLRERLAGLLYTKSSLIDLSSASLNDLTFEVFTTDQSFHGSKKEAEKEESPAMQAASKALQLVKGVKLGRNLTKIHEDSDLYTSMNSRVQKFIVDFL